MLEIEQLQKSINTENSRLEKKKGENEKQLRIYELNEAKYKRIEQNNKHQMKLHEEQAQKKKKEQEALKKA